MKLRQQDVTVPHFKIPFQLGGRGGGAFVNEQNSAEDVMDCIKLIISFPIGSRQDSPTFGVPDVPFQVRTTVVPQQIKDAVARWEERISLNAKGEDAIVTDAMLTQMILQTGLSDA
jgi:phage baseplate assembly protein W